MKSWVESANADSDFSIHNVPFGLISTKTDSSTRPATRIGDVVIDIRALATAGALDDAGLSPAALEACAAPTLLDMASLPINDRRAMRQVLQKLLSANVRPENFPADAQLSLIDVQMHLPMPIGDYTDFCISIEHMKKCGKALSGKSIVPAQMPWVPIAYHGRASSIVISGTSFHRPYGQFRPSPEEPPVFAPSRKLDYEVEMAFFVARSTALGERITVESAEEAIFGAVLMNDWSARDIQALEMTPLGPFQSKNFCTTISPWIVTLDALEPFKAPLCDRLAPEPAFLQHDANKSYDLKLSVEIKNDGARCMIADQIRTTEFYWSWPQLLAHQTVSGCNVRVGDLLGTGTCSGKEDNSVGSIAEACEGGSKPWKLSSGKLRTFLEDDDTITFKGYGEKNGIRVGFGECIGTVLPAQ